MESSRLADESASESPIHKFSLVHLKFGDVQAPIASTGITMPDAPGCWYPAEDHRAMRAAAPGYIVIPTDQT